MECGLLSPFSLASCNLLRLATVLLGGSYLRCISPSVISATFWRVVSSTYSLITNHLPSLWSPETNGTLLEKLVTLSMSHSSLLMSDIFQVSTTSLLTLSSALKSTRYQPYPTSTTKLWQRDRLLRILHFHKTLLSLSLIHISEPTRL